MATIYHMVILDYHEYVGKPVPCIREEITRDPKKVGEVETSMQALLGVYVRHTNETEYSAELRLKKFREHLEKKFGPLERSVQTPKES